MGRGGQGLVAEPAAERRVERLLDERALARAADARHDAEDAERERDVEVLEVVAACAGEAELPVVGGRRRSGTATRRRPLRKSPVAEPGDRGDPRGRADVEQVPARLARPRADVHEQVGRAHDRLVVLDDDHRVARVAEAADDRDQAADVAAGGGPIEGSSST